MDTKQKIKFARVLGTICIVIGAVNLIIAAVDRPAGPALSVTGISALTTGIILIAVSKKKSTLGD